MKVFIVCLLVALAHAATGLPRTAHRRQFNRYHKRQTYDGLEPIAMESAPIESVPVPIENVPVPQIESDFAQAPVETAPIAVEDEAQFDTPEQTFEVPQEQEVVPPKKTKKNKQKKQSEEEDETQAGPFGTNAARTYNSFFPIVFGRSFGYGRNYEDGYVAAPSTAIANSFSTGKAGVASSSATAYGNPENLYRKYKKTQLDEYDA